MAARNSGIDGRIGAADGSHRGEAFSCKEHTLADARVHGVERKHGIAAISAVEVEWLDDKNLASFVRWRLLCGDNITNDASNQHGMKSRV